jgi:hypothetical protein
MRKKYSGAVYTYGKEGLQQTYFCLNHSGDYFYVTD